MCQAEIGLNWHGYLGSGCQCGVDRVSSTCALGGEEQGPGPGRSSLCAVLKHTQNLFDE